MICNIGSIGHTYESPKGRILHYFNDVEVFITYSTDSFIIIRI